MSGPHASLWPHIIPIMGFCPAKIKEICWVEKHPSGRFISRILSSGTSPPGRSSLWAARRRAAQCDLPETGSLITWESAYEDEQSPAIRGWLRLYLVLLPAGVTWPSTLLQMPVVFYTTFSPSPSPLAEWAGCLFLWPLSGRLAPLGGFPAPGAIRRRALWSADFPRSRQRKTAIAQPTWGGTIIHATEESVNSNRTFQTTFINKNDCW